MGYGLWTLGKVEGNLKTLLYASIIIDVLLIPILLVGFHASIYNNVKLLSVVCVWYIVPKNTKKKDINIRFICSLLLHFNYASQAR